MYTHLSHSTQERLKSLSEQFILFCKDNNPPYVDQSIKEENLKFNLAWVIAHVILNLNFIDRSPDIFKKVIGTYNQVNNTELTIEDFENEGWIRTVLGECVIPAQVSKFIWKVGYDEENGKPVNLPLGKEDLTRCLQNYYKQCFKDSKLTISLEKLNETIRLKGTPFISLTFFEHREVIRYDIAINQYYWVGGEYARHLGAEICATLWLLIMKENPTEINFRKFFKLVKGTDLNPAGIKKFLNNKEAIKVCEYSVSFLQAEFDLANSEQEFKKAWLDSPSYQHIEMNAEIPKIVFPHGTTVDFIDDVNYHAFRFHDLFEYQATRNFCYSLLKLVVENDLEYLDPFENTLKIISDTSRPFLVWTLYKNIKTDYPQIIPHLLRNLDLAPIAFRIIDKMEINSAFLMEQNDRSKRALKEYALVNELWLETFDFFLDDFVPVNDNINIGDIIAKILIDLAERVFVFNPNNPNSIAYHNAVLDRYKECLERLLNKRHLSDNIYSGPSVRPKFIFLVVTPIAQYLENRLKNAKPSHTGFLGLQLGCLDLSIEILRFLNIRDSQVGLLDKKELDLRNTYKSLVSTLKDIVIRFYSEEMIDVVSQNYDGIERKTAQRGVNDFGFEIIDWGYLYLHFEDNKVLDELNESFLKALKFNKDETKFDKQNKEQYEKIKLYLKASTLALESINQKTTQYEIENLPLATTLAKLEEWILNLSITHSVDDLLNERIDVFTKQYDMFRGSIYYVPLTTMLYRSISYLDQAKQIQFVDNFFYGSIDIGRMLTAINILDSKNVTDAISRRISEVSFDKFIDSIYSAIELQYALIEAVNSDKHWILAKPLYDKILAHFKNRDIRDENTEKLLFEVNLLLAFKEKDFNRLEKTTMPTRQWLNTEDVIKIGNQKTFFVALYRIYNDKKYSIGIEILKMLLSKEPQRVRYAFHLFRSETLLAVKEKDKSGLLRAYNDWERFTNTLSKDERNELSELTEAIASNKLHYYAEFKESIKFDQTIDLLSKRYLYQEEVIPTIYGFYIVRNLHEVAFNFIQASSDYFIKKGEGVPHEISKLIENSENTKLLVRYKDSFGKIRNLSPRSIPMITPDAINNKRSLNEFILEEILQALRVLNEKREAVKQITHENRYNDYILAILKLRFPIWGWSISDQPRLGTSSGGADAGNADLVIESGGAKKIALIEAFILRDKEYTQTHVLKCEKYIDSINRYYVVIYCLDSSIDSEKQWLKYTEDVLDISYPDSFMLNRSNGVMDITQEFDDIRNFKIGKTVHATNVEMFHIMISLA